MTRDEPAREAYLDRAALEARGYEPLFNGSDLTGWSNPYTHGTAKVDNGEILLRANRKFFLVTDQEYTDFRLVAEIKLPPGRANSGIMFRCQVEPNRVFGYQAECDGSDRRWSGGLLDEGRRKWMWPSTVNRSPPELVPKAEESQAAFKKPEIRDALKRNDWNQYVIECRGDRIVIRLNGVKVTDLRDSVDAVGRIGIQHHGEQGQVYRFRNLFIKELPSIPATGAVELIDQAPISIEEVGPGVSLIDFGKVAFGNLRLSGTLPTSGPVTVRFGERLVEGRVDRNPPRTIRYSERRVRVSGAEPLLVEPVVTGRNVQQTANNTPAVLTPPEWGAVAPFRWVEIEGAERPPALDEVVRNAAFDKNWDDDAAAFECSDPTVNAVWDLCKYSIKATTFAGVYVDGDRERIPYEADAYINQLSHYYAEGDVEMARQTFDWLLDYPTWPTEWAPHMVLMAHADWLQTGDTAWLAPRYNSLKCKTLQNRADATGLVRSSEVQRKRNDIVDWPQNERDGYVFTGANTVVNAFHLAAVNRMREMAVALGREKEADEYGQIAERGAAAFHEAFFDPARGLYRDGVGTEHTSLQANLFPLAFGLVPEDRRAPLAQWLSNRGMKCSVYAAQFLLEGLFANGADAEALALMIADGDRSWRHMVTQGATITWEAWDIRYKKNLDWNHAWGAAPANLLPRFVLGVEPKTAGWREAWVHPHSSGLTYAKGRVPTPHGAIEVDWSSGSEFSIAVNIPNEIQATVSLPAADERHSVYVDDRRVDATLADGRWVLDETLSGQATIVVR